MMATVSNLSRRKGLRGEREAAQIWKDAGAAVRNLEYDGDHLILTATGTVLHQEVKLAERWKMGEWIAQCERDAPNYTPFVLALRRNNGDWYGLMNLHVLAKIVCS